MSKSYILSNTPNDNSIEGSRLVDGSVPLSKLEGGGLDASNVAYTASSTGAVARTVEGALDDWVSVTDFGADPTGSTGSSDAINAAIQASPKIFFPTGNYLIDANIAINTQNTTIDFCGSTLTRGTAGRLINVTNSGYLRLYNGVIDGLNTGANRAMLIQINASGKDVVMRDMTYLNNCAGYPTTPTQFQDTDLVYVIRCARFVAENCVFRVASRQGISFTAIVPDTRIRGCTFEDCYLFAIDYEPNTSSTHMYDSVVIEGNNIINCGPKSASDRVWNSGGPIAIASASTGVQIARNITFSNNRIISTDFFSASPTEVEPYVRITQYETLTFSNNSVINLDRVLFGDFGNLHQSTTVTGNNFCALPGGMSGIVFSYGIGGEMTISANRFTTLYTGGSSAVTITGNTFSGGVVPTSGVPDPFTITGNSFMTSGTCINTGGKSDGLVIVGNNSSNDSVFIGPAALTDSVVANNRYSGTVA